MQHLPDFARLAVALHLGVPVEAVPGDAHLERDLHLDGFDVVLILLRIEELAATGYPITNGEVCAIETLADLRALVDTWFWLATERDTLTEHAC